MRRIVLGLLVLLCALPVAAQQTTLTLWTRLPAEQTNAIFDAFRKGHPEIGLQVENIPGGKNQINKLMAAVAARTPPDIAVLDVIGTSQFAAIGALMPLDDLIAADAALSPAQFSPAQVQTGLFGGKQVALPFGGDASAVFYNRDMFRERGLDPEQPPRTWEQFVDAAKRLTVPGQTYGFEIFPGYPTMTTFYGLPYFWMAGGTFMDPKTNLYSFASPAGVQALEFLADLDRKHHVLLPSAIGKTGDADVLLDFRQKRVAMTLGGVSQIGQFAAQPAGFDVGAFAHPSPKPDTASTSFVGGDNLSIMAGMPQAKRQAAITLLRYLTSAEGQRGWWTTKAKLPVRKDMLDDPYYRTHPIEKVLLTAYVTGHEPPATSHYVEIQQYLRDAYQEVFLGQLSAKEALAEAQSQGNALIRRTGTP